MHAHIRILMSKTSWLIYIVRVYIKQKFTSDNNKVKNIINFFTVD